MTDLFATYGPDALAWVLAALGSLLSAYVWTALRAGFARDALQRAWVEVQGAVLEVAQTYADAIKRASADGTLTDEEKLEARTRAIEIAKGNLGRKGLARLGRIIGVDVDRWLASKTEQAVKLIKDPVAAAALAGGAITIPPPFAAPTTPPGLPPPVPRRPA